MELRRKQGNVRYWLHWMVMSECLACMRCERKSKRRSNGGRVLQAAGGGCWQVGCVVLGVSRLVSVGFTCR